ncbi:MAG TPA: hypothetical protein VLI45_09240 [Acidobacteriaceae bacterium]|nr:hypothetical protein [Acidobacteriaceae bacterium]
MKVLTFAAIAAAFSTRYPNAGAAEPGIISSMSGAQGTADSLQAAAVRGFAAPTAKLVFVRVTEPFFVSAGEHVSTGDFVQVQEPDAKRLIAAGRAEPATDAEVADAQQEAAAPKGKK